MNTPRAVIAVLVALGLVVVVGGAAALASDDGLQYPDEWDPRVEELAAITEDLRGLDFEHPVSIYFLTEDEYRDLATAADQGEPSEAEREEAAKQVAMMRAIGVVEGEFDLLESSDAIADSGTLAYYDPITDVINVRGDELTAGLRVTLVHELT
ncbi:MAG TPA: hypothetical protein VJM33_20325, partial [Microthrixaceae bacterium]|nr:hypothetical protein [Microthrixaceae bacterium]